MSDNPQRLTRFDADGARDPDGLLDPEGSGYVPEPPWDEPGPTFTPTERQRRRIAGARTWIALRGLGTPYSGELDTGTVHGPFPCRLDGEHLAQFGIYPADVCPCGRYRVGDGCPR